MQTGGRYILDDGWELKIKQCVFIIVSFVLARGSLLDHLGPRETKLKRSIKPFGTTVNTT